MDYEYEGYETPKKSRVTTSTAPGSYSRKTICLATKRKIVNEAYNLVNAHRTHLFTVAKLHKVRPSQIRLWAKSFTASDQHVDSLTKVPDGSRTKSMDSGASTNILDGTVASTATGTSNSSYDIEDEEFSDDSDDEDYVSAEADEVSALTVVESEQDKKLKATETHLLQRYAKKAKKRLTSLHKTRLPGSGSHRRFSQEVVDGLKKFFFEQREITNSVSLLSLRNEARRINRYEINQIPNNNPYKPYHALNQRLYRLLLIWDQSYRKATRIAQNNIFEPNIIKDFNEYVNEKIKRFKFQPHCVFNIDQTNVPYCIDQLYTWGQKGANTISIRKADTTNRLSCLLGVNMSGTLKLLPHLVFHGKTTRGNTVLKELREKVGYPDNCTYFVQEKAWFNEEVLLDWIENHWKPFLDQHGIEHAYLIIDSCKVHMTHDVREAFLRSNTEVDYIPKGYTSKLQPLDVGINAPFKRYIRNEVELYLMENPGAKVKIHRRNVSKWISNSFDKVTQTTIVNSWRKSGFNMNMIEDYRGFENDILYDDDNEDSEFSQIVGNPYTA